MMNLGTLLNALAEEMRIAPELTQERSEQSVHGIFSDSRQVVQGAVFVAVNGTTYDGHNAIDDAIERGAIAIVVQTAPVSPVPVPCIHVRDTRLAYAVLTVTLAGNPGLQLRIYGVTGTNGKTTCATLLEQLYGNVGRHVGFIGTTGNRYAGLQYDTRYSTPHAGELTQLFNAMLQVGVETVCMEVSSHALDQFRVYGVGFRGAIFTNLTRDHLDYHGTMENYANAKKKLFDNLSSDAIAVLWGDSEWAPYMKRHCPANMAVTVGTGRGNQIQVTDVDMDISGTTFNLVRHNAGLARLPERMAIRTKLLGEFNVANVALVVVMAILDGTSPDEVSRIIPSLHGPKGRMEVHSTASGTIAIVDYAHTPDALDNVLRVVRSFANQGTHERKLHVVFGCGGDRDKGKRSEMGRIASSLADSVIITTDNPRTEHPQDIVNNILSGVDAYDYSKVRVIEDRRTALHTALDQAGPIDVVIIAGKGHEEYQIIGDRRLAFSDADEISAWSAKHKKAPLD